MEVQGTCLSGIGTLALIQSATSGTQRKFVYLPCYFGCEWGIWVSHDVAVFFSLDLLVWLRPACEFTVLIWGLPSVRVNLAVNSGLKGTDPWPSNSRHYDFPMAMFHSFIEKKVTRLPISILGCRIGGESLFVSTTYDTVFHCKKARCRERNMVTPVASCRSVVLKCGLQTLWTFTEFAYKISSLSDIYLILHNSSTITVRK